MANYLLPDVTADVSVRNDLEISILRATDIARLYGLDGFSLRFSLYPGAGQKKVAPAPKTGYDRQKSLWLAHHIFCTLVHSNFYNLVIRHHCFYQSSLSNF